jgi:hypothetical protein
MSWLPNRIVLAIPDWIATIAIVILVGGAVTLIFVLRARRSN